MKFEPSRKIAAELARTDPRHLTLEVRKNKRAGRIFIDTARNAYAQTAAPPYAIRPRRGAPVAAPLEWTELEDPRLRPDRYTIRNIFDRLERKGDVWKNLNRHARGL
jgi:bifunctional non-homologous end joining protein LigD